MKNFIFGFISTVIAFIISPQNKLTGDGLTKYDLIIYHSIIAGAILSFSSFVNGCNGRMIKRSMWDFIVNVIVSSVGGFGLFCLVIYIFKFAMVGRWVALIAVCFYVSLVFIYNLIVSKMLVDRVKVFSLNPHRLEEDMRYLGVNIMDLEVKDLKDCWQSGFFLNDMRGGVFFSEYYIINRSEIYDYNQIVRELPFAVLERCCSFNYFVEKEYEFLDLRSVAYRDWWEVPTNLRGVGFPVIKRAIDVLCVFIMSLPAVIVLLVAAVAIRLSDAGPIFYYQKRLGQYGKLFTIIKLRTMKVDSEASGAMWAAVGDSRVTFIGKMLRKTRIDELPQLWNILRGEMSMVGPRPERPEFYSLIQTEIPQFGLRLACKPGLTGWAQINYPYGASINDAKMKLIYDLFYIKNAGFMMDMRVLTRTLVAMVKGAR